MIFVFVWISIIFSNSFFPLFPLFSYCCRCCCCSSSSSFSFCFKAAFECDIHLTNAVSRILQKWMSLPKYCDQCELGECGANAIIGSNRLAEAPGSVVWVSLSEIQLRIPNAISHCWFLLLIILTTSTNSRSHSLEQQRATVPQLFWRSFDFGNFASSLLGEPQRCICTTVHCVKFKPTINIKWNTQCDYILCQKRWKFLTGKFISARGCPEIYVVTAKPCQYELPYCGSEVEDTFTKYM